MIRKKTWNRKNTIVHGINRVQLNHKQVTVTCRYFVDEPGLNSKGSSHLRGVSITDRPEDFHSLPHFFRQMHSQYLTLDHVSTMYNLT
jgi:hypothetical protein